MKRGFRLAVMLLTLLLSLPAQAWDERGHRVVAAIAWEHLGHATRHWVEDILLQHPDPTARSREGAAIWADRIRRRRPQSTGWHFINLPLSQSSLEMPSPRDGEHILWALDHWQRVAQATGEAPLRAEALAFLIHLVGDVHQPLHCVSYFDDFFPQGDRGGGKILISHSWSKNLHSLWDSAGYPKELSDQTLTMLAQQSACGALALEHEPLAWVRESYEWARLAGYPGGRPPDSIDEGYLEPLRRICAQRLHLAGLRLAHCLRRLGPEAGYAGGSPAPEGNSRGHEDHGTGQVLRRAGR